jgi:hypothetical protein
MASASNVSGISRNSSNQADRLSIFKDPMMGARQYIYAFEDGDGKNKILLGGKGAGLCEMTQIGLNVPPGFTVTTDACLAYLESNRLPDGLMDEIKGHMAAKALAVP